jgi:hypothetical protein
MNLKILKIKKIKKLKKKKIFIKNKILYLIDVIHGFN